LELLNREGFIDTHYGRFFFAIVCCRY